MHMTAVTLWCVLYLGVVEGNCCWPQQWLGSLDQIASPSPSIIRAKMAYDAVNKMVAMNVSDVNGKHLSQILDYYQTNVSYNVVNGKCSKDRLLTPQPPRCIPDDAKVVGESYLGAGNNTLHYKIYQYKMFNSTLFASLTKECIPISQTFYYDLPRVQSRISINSNKRTTAAEGVSVVVLQFSGLVPEIKDRSVFEIPAVCKRRIDDKNDLNMANHIRRKTNSIVF